MSRRELAGGPDTGRAARHALLPIGNGAAEAYTFASEVAAKLLLLPGDIGIC